MPERLPYVESCQFLITEGLIGDEVVPPLPEQPPRFDDETLGVGFFKTELAKAKLDGLTLPRTYFGRSGITDVTFRDTDLSESTACWNDFVDVDFGGADLSRADLRASDFVRVSFNGASLRGADLRRSTFTDCSFADADMTGAKFVRVSESLPDLSSAQQAAVEWHNELGEEPGGG